MRCGNDGQPEAGLLEKSKRLTTKRLKKLGFGEGDDEAATANARTADGPWNGSTQTGTR